MRSPLDDCDPERLAELIETEPVTPASLLVEGAGTRIGRYKLLQLVGEGGFGSVFMAEQETPVLRKVALKIIKLGMDTKLVIARFEAERQALAMMDHPNIAKVLDAGATETGRPYFVMELVKGMPITEYCDHAHLAPRQRLELFTQVCKAVQHAHQKGIIHRDIKPSNVLVTLHDGTPVPKVIDFGIAKAINQRLTEHTLFTEYRQLIGTPEYSSPEQADLSGLDVDTRSDIYSLGVLLYQLLTGTTPLDSKQLRAAGHAEIQRIIREVEPPKPSTRLSTLGAGLQTLATHMAIEPKRLSKLVAGELDWIVMKCLEKDRNRRYETANGLAQDVQRHLSGDPVEASPPSAVYRLRKFARKHRVAMGIVLLLLVATSVSSWQAVRATRAQAATLVQMQRADDQAAMAQAVNDFLNEDVLGQASPGNQGVPGHAPDRDLRVRDALDSASTRIGGRFQKQPLLEARIRRTIGEAYRDLGEYEKAGQLMNAALQLDRDAVGSEHADTLKTLSDIADLYACQGHFSTAEPLFLEALAGQRKILGEDNRATLSTLSGLAEFYSDQGASANAERLLLQVLQERRNALGEDDRDTLASIRDVAALRMDQHRYAEAEPLFEKALDGERKVLGEKHLQTTLTMNGLALLYQFEGKYQKAEAMFLQAVEVMRVTLGEQHSNTLVVLNNLAQLYEAEGEYAKAESLMIQALESRRKVSGDLHPQTLIAQGTLGQFYENRKQYAKAEPLLLKTLEGMQSTLGDNDGRTLVSMTVVANLYADQGQIAKAEVLYLKALAGQRRFLQEGHPETLTTLNNLATLYSHQGRYSEAEPLFREQFEKNCKKLGDHHPDTPLSLSNLAFIYQRQEQYAKALPMWQGVTEYCIANSDGIPGHRIKAADSLPYLIACYRALGEQDKAAEWGQKLHAILETSVGVRIRDKTAALTTRPAESALWSDRAGFYLLAGDFRAAANDFARAIELTPDNHRYWHDGLVPLLLQLGDVEGFRRQRSLELMRFATTSDTAAAHRVAKDALMMPLEGQQLTIAVKLAEQALSDPHREWGYQTKGMAEYRLGRFQEAIPWLLKSREATEWGHSKTIADLFVAMSYERSGEYSKATVAQDRAINTMDSKFPGAGEGNLGGYSDWILCQVVRREAAAMINSRAPTTRPATFTADTATSRPR